MFTPKASNDGWLPDDGVLLHVGPHKTGTTALQGALIASQPALKSHDVGVGTLGRAAPSAVTQHRMTGRPVGTFPDISEWHKQLKQARKNRKHKFVLSSEIFGTATSSQARRIVDDLGGGRVRVLITVRPLEKILPSTWQQRVKHGGTKRMMPWLKGIMRGPHVSDMGERAAWFWHRHDHAALAQRWADVVGPENVRVLIVDSSNPDQLYRDAEALIGVPAHTLVPGPRANRSMTAVETEAVRQVFVAIKPTTSMWHGFLWVSRGAVLDLLDNRVPGKDEARIALPRWAVLRAREFGAAALETLSASPIQVIGDPEVMVPVTAPKVVGRETPDLVDTEIVAFLMRGAYNKAALELHEAQDTGFLGTNSRSGRLLTKVRRKVGQPV